MSEQENPETGSEPESELQPKEIQQQSHSSRDIAIKGDGEIQTVNFEQQYKLAEFYVKSGMLPKQYNSAAKVITGMQYARELGLKQLTALRQITVINGTPSVFGDLPLAMVRASGKLESIKEFVFDEKQKEICLRNKNLTEKPLGAACVVKRIGQVKATFTFTLQDAMDANLTNKDVWKNYLKTMLKYRARSQALKDTFGDVLAGIAIAEYDFNELPRNDIGAPLSDEPEVVQDRDDKITKEKLAGIQQITDSFAYLGFNEAQRIKYISKYLQVEDMYFATLENIDKMNAKLGKEIQEKQNAQKEN